jgi:hypothetical protein
MTGETRQTACVKGRWLEAGVNRASPRLPLGPGQAQGPIANKSCTPDTGTSRGSRDYGQLPRCLSLPLSGGDVVIRTTDCASWR